MKVALVVAMARNRVIGRDNRLPWHLPEDLRHFRELTLGKPVIMGRKTFESIGKALPGRTNVVVSRSGSVDPAPSVLRAMDIESALELARAITARDGVEECMVIGGAQIYAACLPRAERIYMTLVEADVAGDTRFPAWDAADWKEVSRRQGERAEGMGLNYWFIVLERNGTTPNSNAD